MDDSISANPAPDKVPDEVYVEVEKLMNQLTVTLMGHPQESVVPIIFWIRDYLREVTSQYDPELAARTFPTEFEAHPARSAAAAATDSSTPAAAPDTSTPAAPDSSAAGRASTRGRAVRPKSHTRMEDDGFIDDGNDADGDATIPPKTPRRGKKKAGEPKTPVVQKKVQALVPKTPLSSKFSTEQLSIIQENLKAALMKLTETGGDEDDPADGAKTLTERQVSQLMQWLFVEFCSLKGLERALNLATLVKTTLDEDGADLGAVQRVELVSMADSTPNVAKECLRSLSNVLRYNDKPDCPAYTQFMNYVSRYDLRVHYRECIRAIDSSDNNPAFDVDFYHTVMQYMRDCPEPNNPSPKPETMIRLWFCHKTGLDRQPLNNILEKSAPLEDLITTFGKGIVPLLTREFNHELRQYPRRLLRKAWPLFVQYCPDLRQFCDKVNQGISRYLEISMAPQCKPVITADDGQEPVLDRLTRALEIGGDDASDDMEVDE